MYAKLVMSSAPGMYSDFARDIVRLVTSNSPTTALLSSSTWNVAASTIVDPTPAGWTYVGSNVAGENVTLAAVNTGGTPPEPSQFGTVDDLNRWVVSAPCLAPNTSQLKYVSVGAQRDYNFNSGGPGAYVHKATLVLAQSATSGGALTNQSYRKYFTNSQGGGDASAANWGFYGTGTYHLIANARHITLIKENSHMQAIWEHTSTDLHVRYGITPVMHYSWYATNVGSAPAWASGTGVVAAGGTGSSGAWLVNITDVATGTTYGALNIAAATNTIQSNGVAQPYLWPNLNEANTISSTGASRQLVSPVMFQYYAYGYPTMYVTGVVPIYICKGGIGSAGDSVNVNGTDYIYIPVNAAFGVAIQSS